MQEIDVVKHKWILHERISWPMTEKLLILLTAIGIQDADKYRQRRFLGPNWPYMMHVPDFPSIDGLIYTNDEYVPIHRERGVAILTYEELIHNIKKLYEQADNNQDINSQD